ncbi:hypothetical protein KKF91_06620 [Myxococcota bacterium]|nr:hypothetical protein [Myxococcota bacterium]
MSALWWLLGLLGGASLLLIAVPLRLRAEGEISDEVIEGWARLCWGGGLLVIEVHSARGLRLRFLWVWLGLKRRSKDAAALAQRKAKQEAKRKAKQEAKRKAKQEAKRKAKRARPGALWWWARRDVLTEILRRAARALDLYADLDVVLGAQDPAKTAWLAQVLPPLLRALPLEARIELSWVEPRLVVAGRAGLRLWGLAMLGFALGLLGDARIRQTLFAARGAKRK